MSKNDNSELFRLKIVLELTRILSAAEGPKSMMKRAAPKIKKLISCESIFLFINKTEEKKLVGHVNEVEISCNLDQTTILGICAVNGHPNYIQNLESDLQWARQKKHFEEHSPKQAVVAPIIHNGRNFGVLLGLISHNNLLENEEIEVFTIVADQFAVYLDNLNLLEKLNQQFLQVCSALGDAIAKKDSYTGGHTKRVSMFSEMIAREMNCTEEQIKEIRLSAALHDVGKIGIEDKILKKNSPLTLEEFNVMKMHPHYGFEILQHITGLEDVVNGMRYHHERPDGTGYPYGLKEDQIPLIAQIISVADTFDAMISTRPYRKGIDPLIAHEEILNCSGKQLVKGVVEAFDRAFRKTSMYHHAKRKSSKKAS